MKKLIIHADAAKDLQEILLLDDQSAKRILALLQQVKSDKTLYGRLRESGYRDAIELRIDVKKWHSLQNEGLDAWRLRLPDLEFLGLSYRVVYGFKPSASTVYILAIVRRENLDYDNPEHPICVRIRRAIAAL